MDLTNFSAKSNGECKASNVRPDSKAVNTVIASAKKRYFTSNTVIIARYLWLMRIKSIFRKIWNSQICA